MRIQSVETRVNNVKRMYVAAAASLTFLVGGSGLVYACGVGVVEQTADACFARPSCVWNETKSACEADTALQLRNGDKYWKFEKNHLSRHINGAVSTVANRFDRYTGLDRQCPDPVVNYLRNYNINPRVSAHLDPANIYLTWPSFSSRQKLELREAWLSLREEGSCRQAFLKGGLANTLKLSSQAKKNWRLAKQGNPFNGIIDCKNWTVYLIPQSKRDAQPDQINWTPEQLKKIQWTASGKHLDSPDDHVFFQQGGGVGFADRGGDHGGAIEFVRNQRQPPASFAEVCKNERELKGDFLGFFVWPLGAGSGLDDEDDHLGEPQWVYRSRQLNAINLDDFRLVKKSPDGSIHSGTNLADAQGNLLLDKGSGDFIGDATGIGLLPPGLQTALQALTPQLKPPTE